MPRPFCHRLSGFLFTRPSPLAVPGQRQEHQQLMECQGTMCAAFVAEFDEAGHVKAGICADTLQAVSLARLASAIEASLGENDDDDDADNIEPNSGPADA